MSKKILVVDDEKTLRDAISDKLKTEGFEVIEATDGETGLDAAKNYKPDLVLLDIVMPNMDGFAMTEKLREYENGEGIAPAKQIPIIYLTNLSQEKGLVESQKKGIFNYLVKSNWKLEDIVKRINSVLESRQ